MISAGIFALVLALTTTIAFFVGRDVGFKSKRFLIEPKLLPFLHEEVVVWTETFSLMMSRGWTVVPAAASADEAVKQFLKRYSIPSDLPKENNEK